MDAVETLVHKGLWIKLIPDDHASSPREYDNIGTMVCWHRRYTLGDEQPGYSPDDYLTSLADQATRRDFYGYFDHAMDYGTDAQRDAARKHREAILERHYVILPLYLYEHGGITMNTGGFSCTWDSGQVGLIYVSMADARKEWPSKSDDELRELARKCLDAEVKTYDQFLTGDVYGYVIEKVDGDEDDEDGEGEELESCWGFFGLEYAREEAISIADAIVAREERDTAECDAIMHL